MSTFCRITGKSRGLPKPNYFPLLPPISPADAKRFCRITGKSYGLPSHHYIPVSLVKNTRKRKCRITGNEASHKFAPEVKRKRVKRKRHVFIAEYRYLSPVLEGVTEQQKLLLELLSTKDGGKISLPDTDSHFVYTVEERNCTLVFSSTLEAAVRDGDIRDIMLDRDSDTVVLKLNKGRNISVDLKEMVPKVDEHSELFEGEGPSADVLNERKKHEEEAKKRKRTDGLNSVKKIFEEKERIAEMQVEKELEITEQKKALVAEVKLKRETINEIKTDEVKDRDTMTEEEEREILNNWKRFDPRHSRAETSLFMCSGDWRDLLKPLVETWDWEEVENELSGSKGMPIITRLPSPTSLKAEVVNLGETLPGIVQSKSLGLHDHIGTIEPIPSVAPFTPLVSEPDEEVQIALKELRDTQVLLKTANVKTVFAEATDLEGEKLKVLLPKLKEIPDLVSRLENGVVSEIERNGEKLSGLIIDIGTAKRFVAGQTVITPGGPVFIPGETLETSLGLEFVPGFVVKTPGSEIPVLIPGQKVMTIVEDSGENPAAVFVAGQTLITRQGEKFVAGQTVHTADGPKFMPGQTVITPDGPKFIPGQLVPSTTVTAKEGKEHPQDRLEGQQNIALRFVPGQSVMTSEGPKFVPGQTIATALGEEIFIAGQCVETERGWEFVPGQSVNTDNGEAKFVAGQTVMTNEGPKFIPGQIVHNDEGPPTFVPGVTIEGKEGLKFVPGKAVQTSEGVRFVEGQLVKTATGSTTFMPGNTTFDKKVKFAAASKLEDMVLKEVIYIPDEGLQPINPSSEVAKTQHASTLYGHMVQTIHGVEFFPGHLTSALPAGKIVPGKLEQSAEGKVKFFPGKLLVDDNALETFVPGQMVMTEKGEQFVPGQVIETSDGAKFVPGQVVESRTGPKFVPGQTMETTEGLRFVPGQIVETAVGPTFIPGQIISTEEGSKFVPGEVLETTEGPRFVPGRVMETEDNRVKFVPGQIVQTKEGQFHFVAPDLHDTPGGDFQFSVQGFEVSPEELQLLRPAYITPSYIPTAGGEMSIDSRMLRQLSEAGMSLGRQVPTDIPAVDIRRRHAMLSEVKSILHTANVNKVEILKDVLQEEYTEESVMERLSVVLRNDTTCVSTESQVGNAREQALETAFLHLSRGNPEFMERVLQKVSKQVDILETEKAATQALQRAIISVVKESSDQRVQEILKDITVMDTKEEDVLKKMDQGGLKTLILQAVGLARALGMSGVAAGLLEVLNDPDTTQVLAKDRMTMDILRRLTVMRQLAERNPNHYMALRQLQNDPEMAKSDPIIRELVRESTALMVVPEEDYMPLESSKDIPSALLHSNNLLAMEEFLFSRNQQTTGTILILKPGFQCVIPRENARGILTGQMAFTVLDENGIRHFEPLHVFSALRMPRLAAHHFSMYSCPVVREEETTYATYTAATLTPGSSCDDLGMLDSYMQPSETTITRRRGTLDSIDGSTLSCTRLNDMDDDTLATNEYSIPRQGDQRCGTLNSQTGLVYAKCNGERSPTPPSGYGTPNARAVDSYTASGETSPTYAKYDGNTNGESTFGDTSTRTFGSEVFDVYAVNQSFRGDDGDSISLKKGDLVEVLDSGQESFKLRSRNSSYLLDKYKNLNNYIESGHGGAPHSVLKNPRSPSHSSGSAKSLTFDSSRLSGGALLSREDMYGSRVLSPIDTRRTHEYSRAYASPRSYDAKRIHDALVTDTYKLKLNDPSLPYSSPRCYDYLGSCGGSRVYDPLRPFNSRRFYESLEFTEPVEPPRVASPSGAYGYYEPRKITSPSAIHAAYSPNPYDPYAHYNAQPMSTYDPRKYEMSPERDIYSPINIRKPAFRLSESPEPFDTRKLESKYRELSPEISASRKLALSPEPVEISRPTIADYEPQFSSTMQRIHIRANILGGKAMKSGSK